MTKKTYEFCIICFLDLISKEHFNGIEYKHQCDTRKKTIKTLAISEINKV